MSMAARHAARWLAFTALTAAFIAVAASADSNTVMLKTEAYVKGPMVYLGDIADISGINADQLASIEVSSAAAPGASKRIDSALLKMRLNGSGMDAVEITGPPSVLTKTMSLDVSKEVLTDDLRTFIQTQLPWQNAETTIDIVDEPDAVVVPDGNVAVRWMPSPTYRWIGQGSFRGEIEVDGQVKRTVFAKANVEAYAEVLVCARDIPRGKTIAGTDLRFEKRAMSTQKGEPIQGLDEVAGMVARDTMLMGEAVSHRSLVPKQLIKRNQTVSVETRAGKLVVRSRARALDNGAAGDVVRLTNPETKAEFQGVVREDGVVVVG
ncbi:MAG: flagellar basal body P-ring formation chaperone FlgA [Candidatus Hydrogenedentes bacterium]|nr:flagellar basal body P-ring formation chaperone FlgA [Candidatus Hydrogenedentota bacterium]